MSVHTSFFGVTKLTGEDSKKFRRQVAYGRPNKLAAASLARGQAILKQLQAKGSITTKIKK